jgi:hypothetical protein
MTIVPPVRPRSRLTRLYARDRVTHYRKVTVATARLTLSCGQMVTGPGAEPGVAILVQWQSWATWR